MIVLIKTHSSLAHQFKCPQQKEGKIEGADKEELQLVEMQPEQQEQKLEQKEQEEQVEQEEENSRILQDMKVNFFILNNREIILKLNVFCHLFCRTLRM